MTNSAERLYTPVPHDAARRFGLDIRRTRASEDGLARDVREGLGRTPKSLPPKYFYDAHGSQLFEQICETEEYYPTRTEQALLQAHADSIVRKTRPECIVEFGSGSAKKIRTVLEAIEKSGRSCSYVPFDVSPSAVEASGRELLARFPWLEVHGIVGDFHMDLDALPRRGPVLFMFLGGTIGNFTPSEATRFLEKLRRHMRPGDHLLLGTDLVKDQRVLNQAYNDRRGITAQFNKNVLRVINTRLDGSFDLDSFEHVAYFAPEEQQIEMYLESQRPQTVRLAGLDLEIRFEAGERILTEISRKFTLESVRRLLSSARLVLNSWFVPESGYFGVSLAEIG